MNRQEFSQQLCGAALIGGFGKLAVAQQQTRDMSETLDFLTRRGKTAKLITSVCTGSMVLGAAGLVRGYKATSHWSVRDLLPQLGAELVVSRGGARP
jgi:cyclohexyl-isocyanide hydratase